jgi:RNA polymerase sigma-70 factor (ECF subfamily)
MEPNLGEDVTLARQIAAGDEAALAIFYERYADSLFAFIYHNLNRSRADAEDVWQEVLLAALRSMPAYQGQARLFTWLCGIARHKIADHLRRQGRLPVDVFSDLPDAKLSAVMASMPLPEELVERQATRVRVIEAMALLGEDYHTALMARYAGDRGVDEVARLLGRTYKATESLLSRARVALREALAQLEERT